MDSVESCPLATVLAARLRAARTELTARWLERIVARVSIDPNRVFPTDDLLDHMPLLVEGIADFVADPARAVGGQAVVMERAMELGGLRYTQGFSEGELQKEYEILGSVLFAFLGRVAGSITPLPEPEEVLACSHRLFQAIAIIQQATTMQFLRHVTAALTERESRLEAFHRALTHEIRNRIGATLGAGQLLTLPGLAESERDELAGVVVRNANGMRLVLDNLLELAQIRTPQRQQRHVRLPAAVAEATRQLRDAAQEARVTVQMAPDLPDVEVAAAAVELCLVNYVSNAIKYADPRRPDQMVEIRGRVVSGPTGLPGEVVIEVADNGLGVPEHAREQLFTRFFRAHEVEVPAVEGTGLGLSIVRETADALGGRAWAEFPPEGGSVFVLAVPCRRAADAAVLRPVFGSTVEG